MQEHDAEYLLGAALKMIAADAPQLETAQIEEVTPGTAHVELPFGRLQGIYPRRLVEFLTSQTSIAPRQVGDIEIQGKSTLVEIPLAYVDQVYAACNQYINKISNKKRRVAPGTHHHQQRAN
jgi:ATP-dependent RNA helicase DeaD